MILLDTGKTPLSNADVLHWVRQKRAQHTREDAEDKEAKRSYHRPKVIANSVRRQETELTDDKYPYVKNSGAYEGAKHNKTVKLIMQRFDEDIWLPREEKLIKKGMTAKQLDALERDHKRCSFTTSELLMLVNLAPENISMLEMMLEGWADRFSPDEMEGILNIITEICRCGDQLPDGVNGKGP